MKFEMFRRLLGAASVFVWAVPGVARAQYDYNLDCVSAFQDQIAFLRDFNAGSMAADLNLDGMVNQTDYDLFIANKVKPNYSVYWMVTNAVQDQSLGYMDRQCGADLPLNRNCLILYEGWFPIMPFTRDGLNFPNEIGYHTMFEDQAGSFANWEANYLAWLAAYDASIPGVLAKAVPLGFSGEVSLDFETVLPNYGLSGALTGSTTQNTKWKQMVATINTPTLNQAFMNRFGWTPPQGVTTWNSLTAAQQEDFCKTVFNYVGIDFYIRTVRQCKILRPLARWGYFALPVGWWEVYDDKRRGYNDELADLWWEIDTFSPAVYQYHWTTTTPASGPCPENTNSPGINSAFFSSTFTEIDRVRSLYGRPGQKTLAFAWWYYTRTAGQCSPDLVELLFVNDINLKHQLYLPRIYGADAVAIWGAFATQNERNPYKWIDKVSEVCPDITARWAPHIRAVTCPK